MPQLNQIVAVIKSKKAHASRSLTDAYSTIQKGTVFNGLTRTYEPKNEDGDRLPGESVQVQVKVDDLLRSVADQLTEYFDVEFTREVANTLAKADVKIGNEVLVKDAPVTYLLFLEKQLVDLRTFAGKLPTLSMDSVWTKDENQGVYASEELKTARNVKTPKVHVLYEATKEHPAQTQAYNEELFVGTWAVRKFSGAIPQTRKDEIISRIDALSEAVKFAREAANSRQVEDQKTAKQIFDFILE